MSEETTREFLTRLWILQGEAGMKNAELARHLGCTPSYIRHMKAGRRGKRIGLDIALAATRIFPELRSFLLPSELPVGNTALPAGNEGGEGPSQ